MFFAVKTLPSDKVVVVSNTHLFPSRVQVPSPKPPSDSNVQVCSSPEFGSLPIICMPATILSLARTVNLAWMKDLFPNHSYVVSTSASGLLADHVPISQSRSFSAVSSSGHSRIEARSHLPSSRTYITR